MKAIYGIVRQWIPEADEKLCKEIIQRTNYPIGGLERFEHQVREEALLYRRNKVMIK